MSVAKRKLAVASHILQIPPYTPGKPEDELVREFGLSRIVLMASNENFLGPSSLAISAMKRAVEKTNRYPDDGGVRLKQALSAKLKVPAGQIILGNGSTDLIELIVRTFVQPGQNCVTADHTFPMFRNAAAAVNAECIQVPVCRFQYDLERILHSLNPQTRILYIANPNNPTGTMIERSDLETFLREVPDDVLVIHDEAYCEYVTSPAYPDGVELLSRYPNLVALRTFSKIHGLAGIRIGYGISSEEVIATLNRIRAPFNTNSVSQAAGVAALQDQEHVKVSCETNFTERTLLEAELSKRDIEFVPSVANFVLLNIPASKRVYEGLLRTGHVVRWMKTFNNHEGIRVTIAGREENASFLAALDSMLIP